MLLVLKVQSYGHQPVPNAAECRLSGIGGTIGRALENDLVLDDPGKQISRVHAKVLFRGGSYFLEDAGSNPSVVNDRPLGKGREVQLSHGDRIVVGDYGLEVRLETTTAAAAGAAVIAPSPVNDSTLPLFEPPPAVLPAPLLPLPVPAGWDGGPAIPALAPDTFAGAKILDVLAGFPVSAGAGSGSGSASFDPLGLNLGLASAPLGLSMPGAFQSVAMLAPAPPAARVAMLAIPDDYDPLADFFPPAAVSAPAQAVAVVVAEAVLPAAPPPPLVARTVALPPPPSPPPPNVIATGAASAALNSPGDDNAVLQALLRGLGLPDLRLKGSAVELAETVGALLREATGGAMDLLLARALTKKESRVEMTMIAVRSNNPLKFFPNAESALTQLLTSAMAGYLPPVPAMESAFADLKAHELAVMVGMRAALAAVLHRFDPAQIDAQLALPTGMDKMLGANRKSRLWDRLVEVYGGIARDADGDLQRLYGEQFSAAYEEQIERLRPGT